MKLIEIPCADQRAFVEDELFDPVARFVLHREIVRSEGVECQYSKSRRRG